MNRPFVRGLQAGCQAGSASIARAFAGLTTVWWLRYKEIRK